MGLDSWVWLPSLGYAGPGSFFPCPELKCGDRALDLVRQKWVNGRRRLILRLLVSEAKASGSLARCLFKGWKG